MTATTTTATNFNAKMFIHSFTDDFSVSQDTIENFNAVLDELELKLGIQGPNDSDSDSDCGYDSY